MAYIDMLGHRAGSLTVVRLAEPGGNGKHAQWVCRCDCGRESVIPSHVLRAKKYKACGCHNGVKRFWPRVNRNTDSGCWEWMGSRTKVGYGRIHWNGRVRLATHIALELSGRQSPPRGMVARHTCDNPPCVNPDHLIVGTQAENARDMMERGRSVKGRKQPRSFAKLTEGQARFIYWMRGYLTGGDLMWLFGVSRSNIHNIWFHRTWVWIHGE